MSHQNKFRLAQSEAQQRLTELSRGDPSDLRDEIALCRLLLESAASESSPATIPLLQTMGRLSQANTTNRLRMGELLAREEVTRIARELCSIVSDEVQGLPGFEDILDRIADRVGEVMKARPRLEDHSDD